MNGANPSRAGHAAAELALLTAMGLFMGAIGPYETEALQLYQRMTYWLICIVGGGLIGIGIDALVAPRIARPGVRLIVVALAMTPAVTLLVMTTGRVLARLPFSLHEYTHMQWRVFVIALPVMAVRTLAWRRPATLVETRTVVAPPLPEAEAAFRQRLSARRRPARLIAIEAHDHYLKVHTDAGTELVTMRFVDALEELALAHGHRTHRSWWIAADAIEAVQWRRGGGEVRLAGGLVAPVSRSQAAALRDAGWF